MRTPLIRSLLVLVLLFSALFPVVPCTIVVLTNGGRVLFCNNEDWTNPRTRIWFVPSVSGRYGCVYVGYDDGWARGGLNTKGLACDWVGGFMERWEPDSRTCVRGNPTERMLESCSTVDEAIAFFQRHKEPDFIRAKIIVADARGASVVIGAKDGKLQIDRADETRSFGYAFARANELLAKSDEPSVNNGEAILQACLQEGRYATKYSNIFDLKSGDIYLYQFHKQLAPARLNLATELKKGGHYYEMPQIHAHLVHPPAPLLINMRPHFLEDFPPIRDPKPEVTQHIRTIIENAMSGCMRSSDYADELWKKISPSGKDIQNDLSRYGKLFSVALVERQDEGKGYSYRYRVEFEKVIVLMHFVLTEHETVAAIQSLGTERKPGADISEQD
jgi:hypothetical protein